VVPAQAEGFKKVFLGENQWYAIRIGPAMKDRIAEIESSMKPYREVSERVEATMPNITAEDLAVALSPFHE